MLAVITGLWRPSEYGPRWIDPVKYCPNPECRYALRHHEGQEYRDEAVTCADCGAELTSERPSWPAPVAKPWGVPWLRLALTLIAPLLVVWLAPKMPLPRLDEAEVERRLGPLAEQVNLTVFALGLGPMLSAFLMVELVALCVPRWRPLRNGGPSGRGRLLLATTRLGLALATVQALSVTLYMERLGLLAENTRLSRLVVPLTLIAGSCALVALAHLLDRAALGGGFSVLTTAFGAASVLPLLRPLGAEPWALLTILIACAGTAFVLRWRPVQALPLPACGVIPLQWSAALVPAALLLADRGVWPGPLRTFGTGEGAGALALRLTITASFAVGLGFLFNGPSKVGAFGPDARGRVSRAVTLSTGYVVGLGTLGWLLARRLELDSFSLIPLVALTAVLLDVIAEARAIGHHGELVPVWPEHRLYAVDGALAALGRSGIPSLARSVNQRALWHFFAPFVPIQIMVPRAQAEEAGKLLHEHFLTIVDRDVENPPPAPTSP